MADGTELEMGDSSWKFSEPVAQQKEQIDWLVDQPEYSKFNTISKRVWG